MPDEAPSTEPIDVRPGFLTEQEFKQHWSALFPATEESDQPPPQQDVGPASVDLHLGSEYYISEMASPAHLSDTEAFVTIPHGEFALLITREVLQVPRNMLGFMTIRITYKGKGLINVSGFHVDPGFTGQFYFSVYNAGPRDIKLKWKEPVFTLFLAALTRETAPYKGAHANQRGLPPNVVAELGGAPVNLVKLNERLSHLETRTNMFFAAAAALTLVLFAAVLERIFG